MGSSSISYFESRYKETNRVVIVFFVAPLYLLYINKIKYDQIIYITRVGGTLTRELTNCAFRFKLLPNFSNSCFWAPPAAVIHLSRENKELFFKFIIVFNPAEKPSSVQSSSSQYSLFHIIFSLECWSADGVFCFEIVDEDVITMIIVTIIGVWLVECSQTTGLFLREFQSARLKQSPTSSTKTSSLSPIQMQILLP